MQNENTLEIGDTGNDVFSLQIRLSNLGFSIEKIEITKKEFGPDTQEKLKEFQKLRGLKINGVLDETTLAVLLEAAFKLGNRQLYLQSPMLKGDDVFDL